jgi:hypothetical protein
LPGRAGAVQDALAPGHVARFARGVASASGFDDLGTDDLGVGGFFLEVFAKLGGDDVFDGLTGFAGNQFHLGLRREFRVGHLHREDAGEAFAHVIAGDVHLGLLGDFIFFDVFVDDARHGGAQAGEMGASVRLRDVVGKAEHLFLIAAVPLHGDLGGDADAVEDAFAHSVDDVGVQYRLAAVDVFDEAFDAAREGEVFMAAVAFVDQFDLHAVVQEGQFADAFGEDFVVEFDLAEDLFVGAEMHLGAAPLGLAEHLER